MLKIVLIFVSLMMMSVYGNNSMEGTFDSCSLQCSNGIGGDVPVSTNHHSPRHLIRGKSGPPGPKGDQGHRGVKGQDGKNCDVTQLNELQSRISELESDVIRQKNASQEDIARLEQNVALVTGKLDDSQDEVVRLKEHVTTLKGQMNASQEDMERNLGFVTNQLNSSLHELVAGVKSDLTILNETLESLKPPPTPPPPPVTGRSCKAMRDNGQNNNGVYTITGGTTPFQAYCNMDVGGYMVFQRRFDGSTDFRQNFQAYTDGFGPLNGEHWLGLEKVHQLTKTGRWQLRVDLVAYDNDQAYITYDDFSIGAGPGYQLNIGAHSGAADSLTYHNGHKFSTPDHDNGDHCPNTCQGAWWYHSCFVSNINAFQYGDNIGGNQGMQWEAFKSSNSLKETTMMIREM